MVMKLVLDLDCLLDEDKKWSLSLNGMGGLLVSLDGY